MILRVLGLCLGLVAGAAVAQTPVSQGSGAVLRALDKLNGTVIDLELAPNGTAQMGRIEIALRECRYPEGNPAGDAFAYIEVRETEEDIPVFAGWMIASSPALNPMEHARYDVWVLRCKTS